MIVFRKYFFGLILSFMGGVIIVPTLFSNSEVDRSSIKSDFIERIQRNCIFLIDTVNLEQIAKLKGKTEEIQPNVVQDVCLKFCEMTIFLCNI